MRHVIRSKHLRLNKGICWLLVLLAGFACSSPFVYDQYQVIEGTSWTKEKSYFFTFDIEDAAVPYNVVLGIRNNNFYPYQNLWLFTMVEQPVGPVQRDTIECVLADDYGKWKGRGITLFESNYPVRENYRFPHAGRYTVSLRQGMRNDNLPGIEEIGLRVERAK